IRGRGKIHMKEPRVHLSLGIAGSCGAIDSEHHSVSSRRRRIGALVSSEEAIGEANVRRGKGKAYGICWPTGEHAGAVKRINAYAIKGGVVSKQVHRQEVGILSWTPTSVPHGHFRIVAKECRMCRIHLYRIEKPPAADGVGGLRHADALPERAAGERGKSEVAYNPAISDRIIKNKRVAIISVGARRASQPGKERIVTSWAGQGIAVLVKNLNRFINRFDIMVRADIAIALRRLATAGVVVSFKGKERSRHVGHRLRNVLKQRLDVWQTGDCGC